MHYDSNITPPGIKLYALGRKSYEKLTNILETPVIIRSTDDFSSQTDVEIDLKQLLSSLKLILVAHGVEVQGVELRGGAAGFVLQQAKGSSSICLPSYNDLDFDIKISEKTTSQGFDLIRSLVFRHIQQLVVASAAIAGQRASDLDVRSLISKMCKIYSERERWSVISLGRAPRSIDLKFVAKIERPFQFSVDSFHVVLDDQLFCPNTLPYCAALFTDIEAMLLRRGADKKQIVMAYSSSGDYEGALIDLNRKLISADRPESIRGGGLLRYCDLLSKGFRSKVEKQKFSKTEQCMCTRFFIDFPDHGQQAVEVGRYLRNHFDNDSDPRRKQFLQILIKVIHRSSVFCIMNRERALTEAVIGSFVANELTRRSSNASSVATRSSSIASS